VQDELELAATGNEDPASSDGCDDSDKSPSSDSGTGSQTSSADDVTDRLLQPQLR